ncbi:DEAD/DEAH box helicase family protein [Ferrovibrio terrae]|uniref:DEAD/DEAH box helicase n=1 Tax=Ferrovibrio terrae TaxID=2594003 RepID=UPI003138391E
MNLKDYQTKVLNRLSDYLESLAKNRDAAREFESFQRARGATPPPIAYCATTWSELASRDLIPKLGATHPTWIPRVNGIQQEVPNICIKVPTGGGKTLLGCHAVGRIGEIFLGRQTGLVVWVVPSDAILRQTYSRLSDRRHPYRMALDAYSGGRTIILKKGDAFTSIDVADNLCVLVIMLQSTVRENDDLLRVFRDSGGYSSFFPAVDDEPGNQAFRQAVLNADILNNLNGSGHFPGTIVRHSLANVLRLLRPVFVIDEGHRAYSELAHQTLMNLNPSFVLELTATPNSNEHKSNILVDVSGTDLKQENMIKLPINILNVDGDDWRATVKRSLVLLDKLSLDAESERKNTGSYVRPILLVRVEATGRDKKDGKRIHSEDVRDYLQKKLRVSPEKVRVKTADINELGDEDLMSPESQVQIVITKDALREGWDCAFAYILTVLSNTTSSRTLTQMVGRILRQPGGELFSTRSLNESYVLSMNQDVKEAVIAVRDGLSNDGMIELGSYVRMISTSSADSVSISSNTKNFPAAINLPVVGRLNGKGLWEEFSPEAHILPLLDWDNIHFRKIAEFDPPQSASETDVSISISKTGSQATAVSVKSNSDTEIPLLGSSLAASVAYLVSTVPNVWQATRILRSAESALVGRGFSSQVVSGARAALVEAIRRDVAEQIQDQSRRIFLSLVKSKEVQLISKTHSGKQIKIPSSFEILKSESDTAVAQRDGSALKKNVYQRIYHSMLNGFELEVVRALDKSKAVNWWYRVPVFGDWSLTGWRDARIFPDFLVSLKKQSGNEEFLVLETKGSHLAGNEDTKYKSELISALFGSSHDEGVYKNWKAAIVMDNNWQADLQALLAP